MSGTEKPRQMTREEILKAMETEPPGGDFLRDGVDEDERPVTQEEWDCVRGAVCPPRQRCVSPDTSARQRSSG